MEYRFLKEGPIHIRFVSLIVIATIHGWYPLSALGLTSWLTESDLSQSVF